jgi:quercetin dioxygenase-like cupin family protein
MHITRAAVHHVKRGPSEYFTGAVWLDEIGGASPASRVRIVRVTFEPAARTAWHTHPFGQTLHILSGVARVQKTGESVIEVHAGDTVWFDAGEKHWHGAAPRSVMVHLAVQQTDEAGVAATWLEHVSDAEYNGAPAS